MVPNFELKFAPVARCLTAGPLERDTKDQVLACRTLTFSKEVEFLFFLRPFHW
jgi:hypothetical protein